MKLKRTNWYYMAGLLPGTMLNICLGMYLARNILWLKTVILLSGAVVCAGIVKKFCAVPHSEKSYGQMKPFGMKLPVSYEVDLYLCEEMSRYEFLNRMVEVISPVRMKEQRTKIAVNPVILEKYGEGFMRIAVLREIRRFEMGTAWKTLVFLAAPLELFLAAVLAIFAFQTEIAAYMGYFAVNVALPFGMVVFLAVVLFCWNRYISKSDIALDSYLLKYFSVKEVEAYIQKVEEMEQKQETENSRKFSQHYAQERIEKLNQ